mgnify:CR=1 FL=1
MFTFYMVPDQEQIHTYLATFKLETPAKIQIKQMQFTKLYLDINCKVWELHYTTRGFIQKTTLEAVAQGLTAAFSLEACRLVDDNKPDTSAKETDYAAAVPAEVEITECTGGPIPEDIPLPPEPPDIEIGATEPVEPPPCFDAINDGGNAAGRLIAMLDLLEKNDAVHLEDYFDSIINEFALLGLPVTVDKKDKKLFGRVESAFLKENTEAYEIQFQTRKQLKIKIELDINPPLKFVTEQHIIQQPYGFPVRCMTLPDLFAGKMHALVYRAWASRIKGRDWYDFEWYISHNVPLDFVHLQERVREFSNQSISKEEFLVLLHKRLAEGNINQVKADVMPFVDNPRNLDFWTNDYFLSVANRLRFC